MVARLWPCGGETNAAGTAVKTAAGGGGVVVEMGVVGVVVVG